MWSFEHTETSTAGAARVWDQYADPSRWPEWDDGLKAVSFTGPFAVGSTGRLKPVGGPATTFRLTQVTPQASFTDVTRLPLARLTFSHRIEATPGGSRITHRVEFSGPLSPLFARLIGRSIAADLPETIQRLARQAEAAHLIEPQ